MVHKLYTLKGDVVSAYKVFPTMMIKKTRGPQSAQLNPLPTCGSTEFEGTFQLVASQLGICVILHIHISNTDKNTEDSDPTGRL